MAQNVYIKIMHMYYLRHLVLNAGEWSTRGCTKNEDLSSDLSTICECTHLTHFAILLSAKPLVPPNPDIQLSLTIIGYVGVSVSIMAMALTVIAFTAFK